MQHGKYGEQKTFPQGRIYCSVCTNAAPWKWDSLCARPSLVWRQWCGWCLPSFDWSSNIELAITEYLSAYSKQKQYQQTLLKRDLQKMQASPMKILFAHCQWSNQRWLLICCLVFKMTNKRSRDTSNCLFHPHLLFYLCFDTWYSFVGWCWQCNTGSFQSFRSFVWAFGYIYLGYVMFYFFYLAQPLCSMSDGLVHRTIYH